MLQELLRCKICGRIFTDPVAITPCSHIFCRGCIASVIEKGFLPPIDEHDPSVKISRGTKQKNSCPTCRGPAFLWTLKRIYVLERVLKTFSEHVSRRSTQNCYNDTPYFPIESNIDVQQASTDIPLGQVVLSESCRNEIRDLSPSVKHPTNSTSENTAEYSTNNTLDPTEPTVPKTEKKGFLAWPNRQDAFFLSAGEPVESLANDCDRKLTSRNSPLPEISDLMRIVHEENEILSRLCEKVKKLENILSSRDDSLG
mmetsp:Transcript_24808/g.38649  ORF Transcript_24808/g.38649 Transcript_24808/m.38649 type:complete len:256 (-) Transcript_24808:7-774(-)